MNAINLLNQSEAEAVFAAMRALKRIGAQLLLTSFHSGGEQITVQEFDGGFVRVELVDVTSELHDSQSAFAAAYGLNSDEPQSDVAAAAGGMTQTAIER